MITIRCAVCWLFLLLLCCAGAQSQQASTDAELLSQERWPELVRQLGPLSNRSAEQEYEYGLALAHLEHWDEARAALLRGGRLEPRDKRFPIELAGIAFKEKQERAAIGYLHRALRLDPKDSYANEFLATIYFLQGNLEAALKYWNRLDSPKPRLDAVRSGSDLRVAPALLDHAFAFSPASVLLLQQLRVSDERTRTLQIFLNPRFDLGADADGRFTATFRAQELNGFGDGTLLALLHTFRGLPFQEATPEYYNLRSTSTNLLSLLRWDPDKRRYLASVSGPLRQNPQWRYRLAVDLRNENWDIRDGFAGRAPVLASLNLRRDEGSVEIDRLIGWRLRWWLAMDASHRDFRNVVPGTLLTSGLLESGFQLRQTGRIAYQILREPEYRLNIAGTASIQAARLWAQTEETFSKLQASLEGHWLPRSRGDDFETFWRAGGGKSFSQMPFDELYTFGLERDNDPELWLRAHIGTRDGRKGSAPLGANYFLSSWETDKNLYSNGIINLRMGPFLDTGKITDATPGLGSQKWLTDAGANVRVRVLGVGVTFTYGKDLRTGNNAFYTTLAH